jgi:hypothetical protein
VEGQIRDAEPPSSDPGVIRVQLKEHKALNDDISSQKGRVRDVLSSAKKVQLYVIFFIAHSVFVITYFFKYA